MGQHRHGWATPGAGRALPALSHSLLGLLATITAPQAEPLHDAVRVPSLSDYTLSLTLLNARATPVWYSWEVEAAVRAYLEPFTSKLQPVFGTTTDSQVLHFADLTTGAKKDEAFGCHYITPEALRQFVGNTKWNMVSPLATNSLELMVYIPPLELRPLRIKATDGSMSSSFLVPRWGGVVVLNDVPECEEEEDCRTLQIPAAALRGAMATVVAQLRVVLGLRANEGLLTLPHTSFLSSRTQGITDWELDGLIRQRLQDSLGETVSALGSLYALLDEQTHMPVEEQIQAAVDSAVALYRGALADASRGEFGPAMVQARGAQSAAERAFFHHSMLPLLYFPNEHLYAVYAPFFLPVCMPVFGALIVLLQKWKKDRKSAKEKAQ